MKNTTFQIQLNYKHLFIMASLILAGMYMFSGHASAAIVTGTGYFNGGTHSADPWNFNSDVILSRTAPSGTPYAIPPTVYDNVNEKADFLNWLDANLQPLNTCPTTHDQWGASFIVNSLLGQPAGSRQECVTSAMWNDLSDRINSTDISIGMQNMDPNSISQNTSFYDPTAPLDFFYAAWPAGPRDILIFTRISTNTPVAYLEIPCGNPIGNLSLPKARRPSISLAPNCTAKNVVISSDDADSAAPVSVSLYYGGPPGVGTLVGTMNINLSGTMSVSTPPITAAQINTWRNGGTSFYALARGVSSGGTQDGLNTTSGAFAAPPCNKAACAGTTLGGPLLAGAPTSFKVKFQLSYPYSSPYTTANPTVRVTVKDPGNATVYSNNAVGYSEIPAGSGAIESSTINFTPTQGGNYTASYQFVGTGAYASVTSPSCGDSVDVNFKPFFQVTGGDVMAGAGVGNGSCTGQPGAGILGWNLNTAASGFAGAGSQAGAFATGTITNFVTGMGLTGGANTLAGYPLSFANSGVGPLVGNPNYGGSFASSTQLPCTPNYFADATGGNAFPGLGSFGVGGGSHDYYITSGPFTFSGGTLAAGNTVTLYVKGDVLITGDVNYGAYTVNNVPRFNLIVQGSIYVAPNVQTLHGVYVAQRDPAVPTSGVVVTCASSTTPSTESYAACNKKLTFIGAVVAEQQIRMSRTWGSLIGTGGVPVEPGELFQYSPELWLTRDPTVNVRVQSYTNLAPVL